MTDEKKPLPGSYEKRGMSTGAKVVLGCGAVMLLGIIAVCGGVGYLGWWGWSQVDAFAQEFVAKGYKRQTGQVLVVPGPVEEPTVYTAQVVQIRGEVNADIAIMAQVTEISGTVNGDIDFTGQILHIKQDGVVKGDIRVAAGQVVKIEGVVEGEITGNYGVIQDVRSETDGNRMPPPLTPEAPVAPEPPKAPAAPEAPAVPEAPPSP
jgi:hypothetical protein